MLQSSLDGRVLGYLKDEDANRVMDRLRLLKIQGDQVPKFTELAFVPKRKNGQFPGLFIFTSLARMMRPVINMKYNQVEFVGAFEQVYMDICIREEEAYPNVRIIRKELYIFILYFYFVNYVSFVL